MNSHNQTSIKASMLGKPALDIIKNERNAQIMGVTSRGIFVKTDTRWLLFLSYENFCGPLTINLPTRIRSKLSNHLPVHIHNQEITIPDAHTAITTRETEVWQPTAADQTFADKDGMQSRLAEFHQYVIRKKPDVALGKLLKAFSGQTETKTQTNQPASSLREKIRQFSSRVKHNEWDQITESIQGLLGAGSGLTPSGDDFIIGFLLTLNRWPGTLIVPQQLSNLNQAVTATAYKDTTTLSANLIECAAQGLADERLIRAVDSLVTGAPQPEIAVKELLTWGNSSGVDALVGIAVALSAQK